MKTPWLAVVLLTLPAMWSSASADANEADMAAIASCLEEASAEGRARTSCIGVVSNPCLEDPSIASNAAMVGCLSREHTVWDDVLNLAYQDLRGSLDSGVANALRAAQRAWIPWRDAKCGIWYEVHQGGTIGGLFAQDCITETTARRAIDLLDLADETGL